VTESTADRKNFKIDAKVYYKRIDPQQHFTIVVRFTPSVPGMAHGRLLIHMTNGAAIPVDLEGTSVSSLPSVEH
jgi:hypothetical protein